MKISIRRIGNSLGIILPKPTLEAWGVGEGDKLELTEHDIRPARRGGFSHQELDEHKRRLAAAVASAFTAHHIRAHSLGNLHRWKANDTWDTAYEEWQHLLEHADDGEMFAVLLWLNVVGQDSKFHEQFGYYADPVDETTATFPKGWNLELEVAKKLGETCKRYGATF